MRCLFALTLTLAFSAPATAQDMPVRSFLPDGSLWTRAEAVRPPATDPELIPDRVLPDGRAYVIVPKDVKAKVRLGLIPAAPTGAVKAVDVVGPAEPTAVALSPDKATLFVGGSDGVHVWAYRVEEDGTLTGGGPYCPLRFRRGAKDPVVPVVALTVDTAGRVYALTPTGVQVFDPTGRPAAVLTLPGSGKPEAIGWDGPKRDRLAVWVGGKMFTRPLTATGVK